MFRPSRTPLALCVFLLLCAGIARAALGALPAPASSQAPYLPAADADALQEVPSASDPAVNLMQDLRRRFDASPRDLGAAVALAKAYIDYSRQVGDAHFAGYAEAVIAPWLALERPPPQALLTQAVILQYRHEFPEARALLQRTLKLEPRNPQALLTLATLDMVQGDYPTAARGCAALTTSGGLSLGLACMGNLRACTGQAAQSLRLLQQAQTLEQQSPPATQAWLHGLVAETAERLGNWTLAEAEYRAALRQLPQDNYLLVAYADFLLDRDRPAEVLPLLANHLQSDTAFLRVALALAHTHAPDTARYTWMMAARFEALRLRGSEYFGREEARFALALQHDALTSLSMATRNWQVQKAPWDARVVLEAALAAHQPQAAREVLDFVQSTHLEDPVIAPLAAQLSAGLQTAAVRP